MSKARDTADLSNGIDVDASGRVSMPSQPAFFAYLIGNQDTISQATDEKVLFNAEDFDRGGNFINSEFTAPVAGIYQFNVCITYYHPDISSRYVRATLFKNGSDFQIEGHSHASQESANDDYTMVSFGAVMELAQNDVISVYAAVANAGVNIAGFNKTTHFSGYLVG